MPGAIPFSDFVRKVVYEAEPCSQNTAPGDLGFGWLYYGLIRNLRPDFVVAIGSRRGFMPFCAGRAVQDNGSGRVIFIDPSYSGDGPPGWSGLGLWNDPAGVEGWIARFGLAGWVTHWRMTSEEAFPAVRETVAGRRLGVVIVDGAHDYATSLRDFEMYSGLMTHGVVLFHDAVNPHCEVSRTLDTLRTRGYPVITLEQDAGLALVEVRPAADVREKWGYLCIPSNRPEEIFSHTRPMIRPGDRVMDMYCGYSPLAPLLEGVELFGWDSDPHIIQELRATMPHHRWERIAETELPFSQALPGQIDVLLGLGVSRGYAGWDPRYVRENAAFLLTSYYPRAAIFETAADYHNAEILHDLAPILARLNYSTRQVDIETDMRSFPRRRLLIAERP